MRTYELRILTLRTREALDFCTGTVFPRHLQSFGHFGIKAHGVWTKEADVLPRAYMLLSYANGADPAEVSQTYMQSAEAAKDTEGLDLTDILGVESTVLLPSTSSLLN